MKKSGRRGVTEAQIRDAIDQVTADGDTPSPAKIRRVLGSGSYSTIGTVLYQWRDERKQAATVSVPEMPASVKKLAGQLWKTAYEAASDQSDCERLGFESERREWQTLKTEMDVEIKSLEKDLDSLRTQVANQESELEAERAKSMEMQTELAVALGRVETLELQLTHFHDERKATHRELAELKKPKRVHAA